MRLSVVSILRKVAVLTLVLLIGMTNFISPASASEEFYEQDSFGIELLKQGAKSAVIFLTPPAICLAADAIATGFFPPAAALAPYCAALAIPAGTASVAANSAAESINIAQAAMSH
jgi:hypothetical protein